MLSNILVLSLVSIFGFGDAGTTAFPLLNVPVGPRACAMGEAFTGLADDVGAVFWNPAGLARLNSLQLGLSHHEWFAGIRDENLSLAAPLGPGCFGVAAVYSTAGDIETWDPANNKGSLATARSGYVSLGYALAPIRELSCGLTFKGLYDDLIEQTGTGVCADIGALYRPFRGIGIGLAGRNLGWGMQYGPDDIPLPIAVRLGVSYENPRFRILLDANAPIDNTPDFHVGGEYLANSILTVRGGYRLGPQDWRTLSLLSGITAGLGINLSVFSLDYAFVPYGQLGFTHRLALRTTFPASVYGRVRIKVTEFKTGQPLPAKFVLEGPQQGNSYTEADGTFVVEGVEPGWLKVTAYARDLTEIEGTVPDCGAKTGTVPRVERSEGLSPVFAEGCSHPTIPARVPSTKYYPVTESVLVESRVTHTVRLVARKSGFGSVWGAVYDARTRMPLAAWVTYSGPERDSVKTSDTEGSFTLRKLKAGEYDFRVKPNDSLYKACTETISLEPGQLLSRTFLLARRSQTIDSLVQPDRMTPDSAQIGSRQPELDNSSGTFVPLEEAAPESLKGQ